MLVTPAGTTHVFVPVSVKILAFFLPSDRAPIVSAPARFTVDPSAIETVAASDNMLAAVVTRNPSFTSTAAPPLQP
ncbi:MAG: hypothetical protein EBU13_09505 [Synechococcaceae bacterium WB5_2A_257]|nr:hypothetical protein [Synechococcaceae bacterium WB5_2A_257]